MVGFAGTAVAALPVSAAGNDRFSVLGKVSPLIRDAVRAVKMEKASAEKLDVKAELRIARPKEGGLSDALIEVIKPYYLER